MRLGLTHVLDLSASTPVGAQPHAFVGVLARAGASPILRTCSLFGVLTWN
jgi:hypothetical protein